ncbi:unnamed protein product [Miscanthus lutarioriparius]|uniref:Uncharacterized protein n=1 Tax=Miscanthus lutarioriparius TaxID=422564 RepID=A0A811RRK6_9POAL|nr:unnamed protein product [Miscanthus lutarioriparius]
MAPQPRATPTGCKTTAPLSLGSTTASLPPQHGLRRRGLRPLSVARDRSSRAVYLNAEFRLFFQGDMSVLSYCTPMKTMADRLANLGAPVTEPDLVLNIHSRSQPQPASSRPAHHHAQASPLLSQDPT